jgi:hypothetical protein
MKGKYATAAEYDAQMGDNCEVALVLVLQAFTTLKDTVRLVGGLVPRYLTPAGEPGVPAHVGTNDVDVVLDVALIDAGQGYASLRDQLTDAGFSRYEAPGKAPSSWQWTRDVGGKRVLVEFLKDAPLPLTQPAIEPIDGERLGGRHALLLARIRRPRGPVHRPVGQRAASRCVDRRAQGVARLLL